ncbi:trichohyalin-like isoform X2 [Liolophura sinensis]
MTRSMEMCGGAPVMRGQSRYQNGGSGLKQSRLELLQADYQKKLMKEKEEKMLHMYEDAQQRALNRVSRPENGTLNRGGSVREFFKERRALEAHGKGGVPPIQQHYSQYQKSPNGSAKTYHSSMSYSSTTSHKSSVSYNSGYGNSHSGPQEYRNSAGRDRANPLAPIEPKNGAASPQSERARGRAPVPPIQQKPRLYQRKLSEGKQDVDRNGNRIYQGQVYQEQGNTGYPGTSPSPHRKAAGPRPPLRWDNHQSKRAGQESSQKLTDFQKWQLEQNKAREERLQRQKLTQQSNSRASEGSEKDEQDSGIDVNEELRRRKEELEARLYAEQAELQRIQTQRQQKDEKEHQKKARQERAERERQRRLEEQRERQRHAEEERRRLQKQRHQDEERRMEEEEEGRHASQASLNSRTHRQSDNEYSTTTRHGHPQRKAQATTHRAAQPDRRSERQRSPSPVNNNEDMYVPGPSTDIYAAAANDSEAYGEHVEMSSCRICGRCFAKDRLSKHQKACKSVSKPRKVFDPVKMRTEGTEQAKYVNSKKYQRKSPPTKKSNWRAQHESFIQSIRYAKKMTEYEASGMKLSDLPPPPPSDTSDYVQCPHCNRRFNAGVAERHIPKCVNIKAKPRPPPKRR